MLRIDYPNYNQISIVEFFMQNEAYELDDELKIVNEILLDERFLEPFITRFDVKIGRGSVPVQPYIRLMYLKEYYEIGYERLIPEVQRNVMLMRFCRIPPTEKLPDPTTLMKLTKKYGDEVIKEINKILVQKAKEKKIIKGKKLRIDTSVIESNTHYPTDTSLLKDSVDKINQEMNNLEKVLPEATKGFKSKIKVIKKQLFETIKITKRRTGEVLEEVVKTTKKMIFTTNEVINSAKRTVNKIVGEVSEKVKNTIEKIDAAINVATRIVEQTRNVLKGSKRIPDRIISVVDQQARPIVKGKVGRKVEFGYKFQIEEVENGFVTGYDVYVGNPSDETLLVSAIDRHVETFEKPPNDVAADRGYSSAANEKMLKEKGVKNIGIPKKGKKSKERKMLEKKSKFRQLFKWRAGIEGRIGCLKREYGLKRSLLVGKAGVSCHVGWGILSHNLDKAAMNWD